MNEEELKKTNLRSGQRDVLYALQRSIVQPEWHRPSEVPVEKDRLLTSSRLAALERKGLVESRYLSPDPQNKMRQYRLTPAGKAWRTSS
jgi:hypothetical protein